MTSREFQFNNGEVVKDKVTGFKGVITGSVYYLTGCNQYLVNAKPKDEFSESVACWYDEGRLEYVSTSILEEDVKGVDNGCDRQAPKR